MNEVTRIHLGRQPFSVSVNCYDSVSPGGFYPFSLTTNGSGSASTASYCYSGVGPDHWVVAGGYESNHVQWGGSTSSTTPTTTTTTTTTSAPPPQGGAAGTSLSQYAGHIVQWAGDTKAQKTAWFVSSTLKRYWIPDTSTYYCLVAHGDSLWSSPLPSSILDQLPDQSGSTATCRILAPKNSPSPVSSQCLSTLASVAVTDVALDVILKSAKTPAIFVRWLRGVKNVDAAKEGLKGLLDINDLAELQSVCKLDFYIS